MGLRDKGFWDNHYELELRNFKDDGDEGDVWFGKNLSRRISSWIVGRMISSPTNCKVLDVGCGNSSTLRAVLNLYRDQVESKSTHSTSNKVELYGIDYSSKSVELSRQILEAQDISDEQIRLFQCDFLDLEKLRSICDTQYDYIIDIGTYDAICLLSPEDELLGTRIRYMNSIHELSKDGTKFILASCNHTEDELLTLLAVKTSEKHSFQSSIVDRIETPKFQFGGKMGSQVCCIIVEFKAIE